MARANQIIILLIAAMNLLGFKQAIASTIEIDRYSFALDVSDKWLAYGLDTEGLPFGDLLQVPHEEWKTTPLAKSTGNLWLKTEITNRLNSDVIVYFQIPTLNIDLLHFHVVNEDRLTRMVKTGESYPFHSRDVKTPRYSFRLALAAGETQTVYLRIASPGLRALFIRLYDQASFEERLLSETVHKSLAFGSLLALAIVYLILFAVSKNRKYLTYSLWLIFVLLLYMRADGYYLGEIGRDIFWWNQWSIIFYCLMAHFMLLIFMRLHEKSASKLVKKTLSLAMSLIFIAIILTAIYYSNPMKAVPVFSLMLLCIICILCNIDSYKKSGHLNPISVTIAINISIMLLGITILKFLDFRQTWLMDTIVYPVVLVEILIFKFMIQELMASRGQTVTLTVTEPKHETLPLLPDKPKEQISLLSEPQYLDQLRAEKLASLGTLTNGLAHELNNPLAIIAGHQYRLLTMANRGPIDSQELLSSSEKIGAAVKRVIRIVDALKAYSQDQRASEDLKPVNIRETIQFTLDLCRERLVSLGIKLSTQPIPDLVIEANQSQIMQVLLNLIDNAVDAVSRQDDKSISIEFRHNVTLIEIAVIDSGPGVPFNEQDQIFDPFYTSHHSKSKKGLGLSIASGIVARHNGKLFLDREYPQTRFVLQLRR